MSMIISIIAPPNVLNATARFEECSDCGRLFNGSECLKQHRVNKYENKTICQLFKYCSALPKLFGIENLCTGYFPHFFNTKNNQTYNGDIPD